MASVYPVSNLDAGQLAHALALALDSGSPPFEGSSPDLQLQEILEVEENARKDLQRINVLKNHLRPIDKLPPEILSNMLQHRNHEWDLVAATHVCRYWRSSLISSPTLWTFLQCHGDKDDDRTRTYLERSKSVAGINLEIDLRSADATFERIVPHIGRVRSLAIHGPAPQVQAIFSSTFCHPAPSLQYLKIKDSLSVHLNGEEGVRLPNNFLGRYAPALHSVNFLGVFPYMSWFPLHNLTRLQFRLMWKMRFIDTGTIFGVLSGSPQLKEVSIGSGRAYTVPGDDFALDSPLSLESLEELKSEGVAAARILRWLRLPRLKKLEVTSEYAKIVDLLPPDGHLLLSKTTKLVYYCPKEDSRVAVFSGGGVTIRVQGDRIHPVNWLSGISLTSYGQIQHLTFCGFDGASATAEITILPIAAFRSLKVLQFDECNLWFVQIASRALDEEETPCPFLREIRYDCEKTFGSLARFARRRESLVGDQIRLVRTFRTK